MPYVDSNTISNPTTGQPILAALGDTWRDNFEYLGRNAPYCKVSKASAFSHNSSGNYLAATFDTEAYDVGGCHSTVSNTSRLTVPASEGGLYIIGARTKWDTNTTGNRDAVIQIDGATNVDAAVMAPVAAGLTQLLCTEVRLSAGSYAEVKLFQDSGGTRTCDVVFWWEWRRV